MFAIVLNGMSVLNDPEQTTINLGFAQNPVQSPGYNGTSMILSGVDGAFVCSSPDAIGPWMYQSLNYLGDRTLRHMCLPMSHDSGMSELTTHTTWATSDNTVTQHRSIGDQLSLGVRAFDIRPVVLEGGTYYTGHYDDVGEEIGWQGGSGQPISEIISQINSFTDNHSELIILNISHELNVAQSYSSFTQNDWNGLFSLLDGLNSRYSAPSANTDLTTIPLKNFIGQNQAAVILRFDFDGTGSSPNFGERAGHGFFYSTSFPDYYDSYTDTNDPDKLVSDQIGKMKQQRSSPDDPVFCLNWAMTMSGADVLTASLLVWADVDMTPRLGPSILPALSDSVYPNFVDLDGVNTTDAVAIATAINCISAT